jgi:chemotaxis protein methyltransferase CheR
MPEQTGIEYLEKNFRSGHPPVIMVSSVARENAELSGRALSLGASDYVEKPNLSNLEIRGEEIRNKIRSAMFSANQSSNMSLEKAFHKKNIIQNPKSKLRIIVLPLSARSRLNFFFSNLSGTQPPTFLLVEGVQDALVELTNVVSNTIKKSVQMVSAVPTELKVDEIFIGEASVLSSFLVKLNQNYQRTSILIYGEVSKGTAKELRNFKNSQIILEDLGSKSGAVELMEVADDVVPHTSFAYLSEEFLS